MSAYSIATRGLAGRKVPQGTLTAMGELLFSASEPGAWYDPSDLSTLFQDAEGTTPVTAVEQPVGRMLDLSGRGNHATQATTTKRPVLSRRVNLLPRTVGNIGANFACTQYPVSGLPGIEERTEIVATALPGVPSVPFIAPSGPIEAVVYANPGAEPLTFLIRNSTTSTNLNSTNLNASSNSTSGAGFSVQKMPNGWFKVVLKQSTGFTSGDSMSFYLGKTSVSPAGSTWNVAGYSVHLEVDAHLPFQRVTTATDYDADPAKFPAYLRFDGVDDALQTENINFTSTDKMTVWAGAFKADNTVEIDYVAYSNGDNYNGFSVYASSNRWFGYSSGAASYTTAGDPLSIANTQNSVIAVSADQIAPSLRIRRDYKQVGESTAAQGGGGYGNRRLYIGARLGTSSYFNGRLYSLIVRGAQSSLSQIEATEAHIKQKMRLS